MKNIFTITAAVLIFSAAFAQSDSAKAYFQKGLTEKTAQH
jgi:hypothetical protein